MKERDLINWIVGFADGESCFNFRAGYNKKTGRFVLTSNFIINLRADEIPILQQVKDFFGCGILTLHRNGAATAAARFDINPIDDLYEVVTPFFLDHPLRTRKREDFAVWQDAIRFQYEIHQRWIPTQRLWCEPEQEAALKFMNKLRGVRKARSIEASRNLKDYSDLGCKKFWEALEAEPDRWPDFIGDAK